MRLEYRLLSASVVICGAAICGCGNSTTDYSHMPPMTPPADPSKDPIMQTATDATKATSNDKKIGTGGAPPP